MESMGEKIKYYRKLNNITQKALGEKLNVSQQLIGQYENNLLKPKIETLSKIADALNIPVTYLMEPINIGLMSKYDREAINFLSNTKKTDEDMQSFLLENDCTLIHVDDGYIIEKELGKRIKISEAEYTELKNDINFFIKFLLDKLFNKHDYYFIDKN